MNHYYDPTYLRALFIAFMLGALLIPLAAHVVTEWWSLYRTTRQERIDERLRRGMRAACARGWVQR